MGLEQRFLLPEHTQFRAPSAHLQLEYSTRSQRYIHREVMNLIYSEITDLAQNLEAYSESFVVHTESRNGFREIFSVLEDGMGTDIAKSWFLVMGLSDERRGQSVLKKETAIMTGSRMQPQHYLRGLMLLKEIFPKHFDSNGISYILENHRQIYPSAGNWEEYSKEAARYVRNRREIIRAERQDDIQSTIREFYSEEEYDTFLQYYRLDKYAGQESAGISGIRSGYQPIRYDQIMKIEAFLELANTKRYPVVLLHDDYQFDFISKTREKKRKYWTDSLMTAELKLRRKSLHMRLNAEVRKPAFRLRYKKEHLDILGIWLDVTTRFGFSADEGAIHKQVAAEFEKTHPYMRMDNLGIAGVMGMFDGRYPENSRLYEQYIRRMEVSRILENDKSERITAQRLRGLLSVMIKSYHVGNTTMIVIGERVDYQSSFLSHLRILTERAMGLHIPEFNTNAMVYEKFEKEFWPEETSHRLPDSFRKILLSYADTQPIRKMEDIAKSNSIGITRNHLVALVEFILGEAPERLNSDRLAGYKRLYYLQRMRYFANSTDPEVRKAIPLTKAEFLLLEKSTTSWRVNDDTSPPIYNFISLNELTDTSRRNPGGISVKMKRIMAICEEVFGPIPNKLFKKFKRLSRHI